MSNNSKLDRVIARFQKRIEECNYYEAHQTLRTIANRYVNSKSYDDAIQLIAHGAQSFLTAKQGGEGTDLIFYLLEIYDMANITVSDSSVARLVQLLILIDPMEPNLKDVVTGMNNWSIKLSECKFGDPHLHNAIAMKLLDAGFVYEAERYLMLGTSESLTKYVDLLWDWFLDSVRDDNVSTVVGDFISRVIFNYLFIVNINFTIRARDLFISKFITKFPQFDFEVISKGDDIFKMWYLNDLPELNFLQLLILVCQTKDTNLFLNLKEQYSNYANKYQSQLDFLGQEYFGIIPPKQSNFLQDMMAGLLGSK